MAQKFLVSKSGKNVLSSSLTPKDYIMHSDYNSFQIVAEGSLLIQSITAEPTTITIAHNQGYIPAVYAFAKYPDGYVAVPNSGHRSSSLSYQRRFYLQVDATNIYLKFYTGVSGSYNVDIKYYIFSSDI